MKKVGVCALAVLAALAVRAADPTSEEAAKSLTLKATEQTAAVALYESVDSQTEESSYVCYYKMTLSKGKKYTLWLEDESPDKSAIAIESAYSKFSESLDVSEPGAIFEPTTYGAQVRWVFTGDDWDADSGWSSSDSSDDGWDDDDWGDDWGDDDDDDWGWDDPVTPSSWTYYLVIRGKQGATAKLHYVQAIAIPEGSLQNPFVATPKTDVQTKHFEFTDNKYYITMSFKAGERYYIGTAGGDDDHQLVFDDLPGFESVEYIPWFSLGNDARVLVASEDLTRTFFIEGVQTNVVGRAADFVWRKDGVRKISEHASTPLAPGSTVSCKPGYKNEPTTLAYDPIVDEVLYSFTAEKGGSYLIETTGATYPLEMVLYDAKGNVLKTNTSKGQDSEDVRCTLEATAKGTYYVGVCEDINDLAGDEPHYASVSLSLSKVAVTGGEIAFAERIAPEPGDGTDDPLETDGNGPYELDGETWYRVLSFAGRADMTYNFGVTLADEFAFVDSRLKFAFFYLSGSKEVPLGELAVKPNGSAIFVPGRNATIYARVSVEDGVGTDYAAFRVHALGYETDGGSCGALNVVPQGTDLATWSINKESVKYSGGDSILLPVGTYTLKYATVKGYSAPASRTVVIKENETTLVDGDYYSDTSDHKDDIATGATKWTLKNTLTSFTRTLWQDDPADYFVFDGKDGYLYDFALTDVGGDAVFSIYNGATPFAEDVTQVTQLALPSSKVKYYLVVAHKDGETPGGGKYTLNGRFANVGAISFAKTAVSAKDTATSVTLTVNRSAKDGAVRVSYTTADDTAKAGEHYESQTGFLEWADGDKKAKTITIKLIPKLIAAYNDGNHAFTVQLADAGGTYPAQITTPSATVTLTETSKETVTVESVYAKKAPKLATVKSSETGALRGGTFFGIVQAEEGALTNGLPELASITLTVSAKGGLADTSKDTLSAKVSLAGKSYAFKTASKEIPWDEQSETEKKKTLELVTTVNKVKYTNTLELAVFDGDATEDEAWLKTLAKAKLTMNVPDANGKGVQKLVAYTGNLYRQNAKIQAYLTAVTNFTGYYTVALANPNSDAHAAPAGHGYMTMTVDNKGTVKVAGLLADNTKLSFSVTASAIQQDDAGAYSMRVPLFAAKSPYCFGGEVTLKATKIGGTHPDGKDFDVVVTAPDGALVWNNDNAALTYGGAEGWSLAPQPVGGWYDTVFNLQNYYKDYALSVSTANISEFPTEALATGYSYVSTTLNDPNGYPVELLGDTLSIEKKSLVRSADKKTYDLDNSVNPFNVQAKLARATGIVTGSFSLWSQDVTGKQKEITGIKHYGIVLLQRDESGILGEENLTAGFFNQTVKLTNGKKTRNWTMSKPFAIQMQKTGE